MATSNDKVTFGKKELRGSRLRCLTLTAMPLKQVARCLTELVYPHGIVDATRDQWMPRGFLEPDEAKLGDDSIFLSVDQRRKVTNWWLAVKERANTPNWDIVSTCTIGNQRGLVLVEAKAHGGELKPDDKCSSSNTNNLDQIAEAIREANAGLNTIIPGWSLSTELRYQLCTRFVWSWKIVTLGVPVILIYLGFLNAEKMADKGQPFRAASEWAEALIGYARGMVPECAWNQKLEIDGTRMWPLIRAMDLRWEALGSRDRSTV